MYIFAIDSVLDAFNNQLCHIFNPYFLFFALVFVRQLQVWTKNTARIRPQLEKVFDRFPCKFLYFLLWILLLLNSFSHHLIVWISAMSSDRRSSSFLALEILLCDYQEVLAETTQSPFRKSQVTKSTSFLDTGLFNDSQNSSLTQLDIKDKNSFVKENRLIVLLR